MVNAVWYIRNSDLHKDLSIPLVVQEIRFSGKHDARLQHHSNPEALQLLENQYLVLRLKRTKHFGFHRCVLRLGTARKKK